MSNPIAKPGRFPLSVPPYSFSMSSKVISMKTSSDESRLDLKVTRVSDKLQRQRVGSKTHGLLKIYIHLF